MCMHNGMCVHMRVLGVRRKVLSSLLMQLLEGRKEAAGQKGAGSLAMLVCGTLCLGKAGL